MNAVAWALVRRGGWGRPLALALSTALTTGLVLVGATWALLPDGSSEVLQILAEPGTRAGAIFGVLLLALAPLLLLDQVVRLGTGTRERRLAALRLAGATPREVNRLGLLEVGLPSVVGATLGPVVPLLLATARGATASETVDGFTTTYDLDFVPADPLPPLPLTVLLGLLVAAVATIVGGRATRRVSVSPLGVTRRQTLGDPSPLPLLLLPAGLVAASGYVLLFGRLGEVGSRLAALAAVLLVVVGLLLSAPWVALQAGRRAERRARDAAGLVAARHLVSDPRPAGRAGAALAAIFLLLGGSVGFTTDVVTNGRGLDFYYLTGLTMIGVGLTAAFVVAVGSLAVHSVESITDRRRATAAMVALGTGGTTLSAVRLREIRLVSTPLAMSGAFLGSGLMSAATTDPLTAVLVTVAVTLTSVVAVRVAARVAVLVTTPWTRDAGAYEHLRTA